MAMRIECPRISQRDEPGNDGRPPENGNMDCVPAALASMARGLNPALTGKITGDGLHDVVYGEGYVGLMDPARFVGVLADRYGMRLVGPIVGSAQALYGRACSEIAAGHPVLMSIPSDWDNNPPRSQYAHMVAGCDVQNNGASATAMNSWLDDYQTETAAWWMERFDRCAYKALWYMERMAVGVGVPTGWHDDGTTLTAPNGHRVVRGFRAYILGTAWDAAQQPTGEEYGVSAGVQQDFQATTRLHWDAATNVTAHPGPDYAAEVAAGNAQIATLQQQLTAARQQIQQLEAEIAQLKAGGAGAPLSKQAIDALRVALAVGD